MKKFLALLTFTVAVAAAFTFAADTRAPAGKYKAAAKCDDGSCCDAASPAAMKDAKSSPTATVAKTSDAAKAAGLN